MLMSVRYMYFGKYWIPNPIISASLVVCCVWGGIKPGMEPEVI